jgi:hypothetical protein
MPEAQLKLGKGASFFVKSRLRRLRQENDTWEADFRALPNPRTQSDTHYLGMVLTQPHGYILADFEVQWTPTVNDLAKLLAEAMRRPMALGSHRPCCLHVRGNPRWQELFPHLKEIGVKVIIQNDLPKVNEAFEEFMDQVKKTRPGRETKPSAEQATVEKLYPAIAKWVQGYGHIEIGDQEGFDFVVRALEHGGLVFEDHKPDTLAEALAALEKGLTKWFDEQGIDLNKGERP